MFGGTGPGTSPDSGSGERRDTRPFPRALFPAAAEVVAALSIDDERLTRLVSLSLNSCLGDSEPDSEDARTALALVVLLDCAALTRPTDVGEFDRWCVRVRGNDHFDAKAFAPAATQIVQRARDAGGTWAQLREQMVRLGEEQSLDTLDPQAWGGTTR